MSSIATLPACSVTIAPEVSNDNLLESLWSHNKPTLCKLIVVDLPGLLFGNNTPVAGVPEYGVTSDQTISLVMSLVMVIVSSALINRTE